MEQPEIAVKQLEYVKDNKFISSKLVLEFNGTGSMFVIANTLRRVSYDDIPTYAFSYINIEHNNSIYNNDQMMTRLKSLPIYDIDNDIDYLHPKYWKDVNYYDKNREKHEEERLVEVNINAFNNKNEIMNVTTKHMTYHIDGKETKYPERDPEEPILLVRLRPNETFKCHMRGNLGVGESDNIWSACRTAFYEYEDTNPGKVKFTIKSAGQMNEYRILIKCCRYIKYKLREMAKEIENKIKTGDTKDEDVIELEFVDEDHTMGNLINNGLQENPKVKYSGLSKPSTIIKTVKIKMMIDKEKEKNVMKPITEVLESQRRTFDSLEKKFIEMEKKIID